MRLPGVNGRVRERGCTRRSNTVQRRVCGRRHGLQGMGGDGGENVVVVGTVEVEVVVAAILAHLLRTCVAATNHREASMSLFGGAWPLLEPETSMLRDNYNQFELSLKSNECLDAVSDHI